MGNASNQTKSYPSLTGEQAYEISLDNSNRLGEGSFATVYKMKRKSDSQMCAGKIFKISLRSMNSKEEKGYERELEILKECEHPFIIEYVEEFEYQDRLCIVTKLASGGDFEKYMRN